MSFGRILKDFTFLELNCLEWSGFIISFVFIHHFGWEILKAIYESWIGPYFHKYVDLQKMGKWAVITGATDGIGKAYAEQIAQQGINVVLISRSLDKLNQVADDIAQEFNVEVKVIAADFTHGDSIYSKIREELADLEIGTLINNVGMAYPYPEYFLNIPEGDKLCLDIMYCNILSVIMMTRIVMKQMAERGKGVVVNVGSISAVIPTPLMSVYGASKAFVDKFTKDLMVEYADKGIVIQSLLPAYVSTGMSRIKVSAGATPTASEFVEIALKTIGLQKRTAAFIPHRIMILAIKTGELLIPNFIIGICYDTLHRMWLKAKRNPGRARNNNNNNKH